MTPRRFRLAGLQLALCIALMYTIVGINASCKKSEKNPADEVACYDPAKVQAAYKKAKGFVKANEAVYMDGTIAPVKIGLYIDMLATEVRMEYYINTIALGKGVTVTSPDGTRVTIDDELIRNYKGALCNETDDVNKKL